MDLAALRAQLLKEREHYQEHLEMMAETGLGDMSHGDQLQEDSTVDNHPADLGSEMFEREKDLGLRSNWFRRISAVERALERMDAGEYGLCEDCGSPIGDERLEAFPSATTCVRCQELREAGPDRFHRPIEEQVLNPPFGRSFRGRTGDPGYDGEDAWQEVASYGTSESPSDVPGAVKFTDMYNSDEDVYTVVDPMDALVDENYEPLQRDDRDRDGGIVNWDGEDGKYQNIYGPDDMGGNYQWDAGSKFRTVMPERQFRNSRFPLR